MLRNVRVLAIDQTVEEKDGQKVVIGKTATVELDPQQAETLALSRQLGTLSLALAQSPRLRNRRPRKAATTSDKMRAVNTVRYGVSTQSTPLIGTEGI